MACEAISLSISDTLHVSLVIDDLLQHQQVAATLVELNTTNSIQRTGQRNNRND
jgi:hypothetical protein